MLEGLAAWFLNNYLGTYLENLNTDQLSIALLQGEVELENVPLRRDALRFVDTALDVRSGLVGRIKLKIPVSKMRSEPWSIAMEKVYIIVGPQRFEDYDEVKDEELALELKMAALDGIESEWRATDDTLRDTNAGYYSSYSSWMTYGTSFIGTIIENLQVQIRDVHVRFEDDITSPSGTPFAFGFSIESLTAQTCDENWTPKFVHREHSQPMAYKLVELQNMATYLNTEAELFGTLPVAELKEKMAIFPGKYSTNEFILNPVSASASIKRNCSAMPLNSRKTPRVICDLQLNSIPLEMSDKQFRCFVSGFRSFNSYKKNRKFWKFRPCTERPIRSSRSKLAAGEASARVWWHCAIAYHIEEIKSRLASVKLDTLLKKCRENVQYVDAFKKYLDNPMGLDAESKECKNFQDVSRTYEELKVLRELSVFYLQRERAAAATATATTVTSSSTSTATPAFPDFDEQTPICSQLPSPSTPPAQSLLQGWFPLWGGWYSTDGGIADEDKKSLSSSEKGQETMQNPLEGEILEMIAGDGRPNVPYKDVIFAQLGFYLKRGTLQLFSKTSSGSGGSNRRLLLEYEFTDTKVECEIRPRTKSFMFSLCLGAMCLRDKLTPNSIFPLLISPQNVQGAPLYHRRREQGAACSGGATSSLPGFGGIARSISSFLSLGSTAPTHSTVTPDQPLFHILYERRPFSASFVDVRLYVRSQPLNMVYNPALVKCLADFFRLPSGVDDDAKRLKERLNAGLEQATQRTKEHLRKNFRNLLSVENFSLEKKAVWDLKLELCAPQILIPEHFIDREARILVMDFGKFYLSNDGHALCAKTEEDARLREEERLRKSSLATSSYFRSYLPSFYVGGGSGLERAEDLEPSFDEEDEEFCTPASTPPSMDEDTMDVRSGEGVYTTGSSKLLTEIPPASSATLIKDKWYDQYTVSLSEMQVIVARVKDNWRYAYMKGTSQLHVLDRFSISLTLERRNVDSTDPDLPGIVVSGVLPKLVVHINEGKVRSVERIISLLIGDFEDSAANSSTAYYADLKAASCQTEDAPISPFDCFQSSGSLDAGARLVTRSHSYLVDDAGSDILSTDDSSDKEGLFSSLKPGGFEDTNGAAKLLLVYFCIADLSVELQSQGKGIAELQVTGVKASLTQRPFDTSATLSVHSLLLVDALQTFGPNYELLVASHKHVTVDNMSGSLLGSEPVSPGSPFSPEPIMGQRPMSPLEITKALSSLASDCKLARASTSSLTGLQLSCPEGLDEFNPTRTHPTLSPLPVDILDPNALISVDVTIISKNCPTLRAETLGKPLQADEEELQIVSIQFNSLDVIANQETIVEILSFLKRVFPGSGLAEQRHHKLRRQIVQTKDGGTQTDLNLHAFASLDSSLYCDHLSEAVDSSTSLTVRRKIEVSAEFQRLNVLLLRAKSGKMIGTALLTEAKVHSTIGGQVLVSGSLGGLQVTNLLSDCTPHNRILSVGRDLFVEEQCKSQPNVHEELYSNLTEKDIPEASQALVFKVKKYCEGEAEVTGRMESGGSGQQTIQVQLQMASVCYLHSVEFLEELNSCASDFKTYIRDLASSIRSAATDLALGIVHHHPHPYRHPTESFGSSNHLEEIHLHSGPSNIRSKQQGKVERSRSGSFRGQSRAWQPEDHQSFCAEYGSLERSYTRRSKRLLKTLVPSAELESATEYKEDFKLELDVVLETPIIVLPRHERSFDVMVAHLGAITVKNIEVCGEGPSLAEGLNCEHCNDAEKDRVDSFVVRVSDVSLHTLNIRKKAFGGDWTGNNRIGENSSGINEELGALEHLKMKTAQEIYSCECEEALPILHDTALEILIDRRAQLRLAKKPDDSSKVAPHFEPEGSSFIFSMDNASPSCHMKQTTNKEKYVQQSISVTAKTMNPLKLSLKKSQYEQVLDSMKNTAAKSFEHPVGERTKGGNKECDVSSAKVSNFDNTTELSGSLDIPVVILELKDEDRPRREESPKDVGLVCLKFHEFAVTYKKDETFKSVTEVTLGSMVMEDLLLGRDSPHRTLATSISKETRSAPAFGSLLPCDSLSTSCPEFWVNPLNLRGSKFTESNGGGSLASSLPNRLDNDEIFGVSGNRGVDRIKNIGDQKRSANKTRPSDYYDDSVFVYKQSQIQPTTPPPSVCSSRTSPLLRGMVQRDLHPYENLVHIRMVNVDPASPDFEQVHNSTSRFVDVDFNTLDIVFNLRSWVSVLNFFGTSQYGEKKSPSMGHRYSNEPFSGKTPKEIPNDDSGSNSRQVTHTNTEFDLKVRSLSVVLNRPEHEVASVTAKNFVSRISFRGSSLAVLGSLGNFSLKDLTSHGLLYKDRFVPRGEQMLNFHFFKFGHKADRTDSDKSDLANLHQDANLKIRMSSVVYVHTQRFHTEMTSFISEFVQLLSVASFGGKDSKTRTPTTKESPVSGAAGSSKASQRGTLIKFDVQAGSLLLLLPMSSFSSQLLVVDLGRLEVSNHFRFSGSGGQEEGGRPSRSVDDVQVRQGFSVNKERKAQARSRSSVRSPKSVRAFSERARLRKKITMSRQGILSDTCFSTDQEEASTAAEEASDLQASKACLLDVFQVSLRSMDLRTAERLSAFVSEEALSAEDITIGSFIVSIDKKPVLEEKCELQLKVERNLDKESNHSVPDMSIKGTLSKIHATVDDEQYMLVRGLLAYNLGENLTEFSRTCDRQPDNTDEVCGSSCNPRDDYVWVGMFLDVELLDVTLDLVQQVRKTSPLQTLARINLIKSRLIFESFSDATMDVDLVSQEIILNDHRFSGMPTNSKTNVFSRILQPMTLGEDKGRSGSNLLQAEVHFRATADSNRFTILLNNMRLMCIFDWWMSFLNFISKSAINPNPPANVNSALATPHFRQRLVRVSEGPEVGDHQKQNQPLFSTAGIVTRRTPASSSAPEGPIFELRINITDSELIVVADPSRMESSAVILRSTTVITYRPDMIERPFSCNLNNAEVFSCVLGKEEESAMSIIDPLTINIEIGIGRSNGESSGGGLISEGLIELAKGGEDDGQDRIAGGDRLAEVQLQQLNIRLSYYDWLMFQAIAESFPRQAREAMSGVNGEVSAKGLEPPHGASGLASKAANIRNQVDQLKVLGYSEEDCCSALIASGGLVEEAAIWLTQNATCCLEAPVGHEEDTSDSGRNPLPISEAYFPGTKISFKRLELKTSSISVCVIDDCKDADVPLAELLLQQLHLKYDIEGSGKAQCAISCSYYNRTLSSWEPFVEPWRCNVGMKATPIGSGGCNRRYNFDIDTSDIINLNLTSTLTDLYQMVKSNWTEDYYSSGPLMPLGTDVTQDGVGESSTPFIDSFRRRTPFVPFALMNETGDLVWFTWQTRLSVAARSFPTKEFPNKRKTSAGINRIIKEADWRKAEPEEVVPFSFEMQGKMRHHDSHEMRVHQVVVQVDGFEAVTPVSVDRVGTFFRMAKATKSDLNESPQVRIVFQVKLEGSARKLIVVRSALLASNLLPHPIELKLVNTAVRVGDVKVLTLKPKEMAPLPLKYVWAKIFVRPLAGKTGEWSYSDNSINWYHIMTTADNSTSVHTCPHIWNKQAVAQRMCVTVRRLNYPIDSAVGTMSHSGAATTSGEMRASFGDELVEPSPRAESGSNSKWIQPAHLITFLSPVMVVNLLPCYLRLSLKSSEQRLDVKPGHESYISVDISESVTLTFSLDVFPGSADLCIAGGTTTAFEAYLRFGDHQGRSLRLSARVSIYLDGALKVSVFSPYWLVNNTGLPLVFRQEGASTDAAGQDDENEVARMASPLMFSFSGDQDPLENSSSLTMRVGKQLHTDGKSQFCKRFNLQLGSTVRRLRVAPQDSRRVDMVYIIGVDVRVGKGRYRDTLIVTFSPRFQIHNQSSYKVQLAQKCFATTFQDPEAEATHLIALPKSTLAFHWPRLDYDQLFCIRILDLEPQGRSDGCSNLGGHQPPHSTTTTSTTNWSGGFRIDLVESFHVTVRSSESGIGGIGSGCLDRSIFIRVEVGIIGATFYVVLSDAANFPPPFRIDNFSEVPITYYQSGVEDQPLLSAVVKAHHSVPYACDEPTYPPHLVMISPGGTTVTYDMDVVGDANQLTYDNFHYIAMGQDGGDRGGTAATSAARVINAASEEELVFDVEGTKVFLAKKASGKRSQLWSVTTDGLLVHEGSSPPIDLTLRRRQSQSHVDVTRANALVLDIAGPAVQPDYYVPLMLRKPDERRRLTQRWRFLGDGRLVCAHKGLYAQAKDSINGLEAGTDIVLGPTKSITNFRTSKGVPIEQALHLQKLRPGSGILSVKVTTDGPTRVVQIMDAELKRTYAYLEERDWFLINEDKRPILITTDEQSSRTDQGRRADYKEAPKNEDEYQIVCNVKAGIGVSLVSSLDEEILYAFLSRVLVHFQTSPRQTMIDGSVHNIQVDNQLQDAHKPIILYLTPPSKNDEYRGLPALQFTLAKSPTARTRSFSNSPDAEIFKHFMITVKNVTLNLEEELLCKVLRFFGATRSDAEMEKMDESAYEAQRAQIANTTTATRYYFGTLSLVLHQVRLSVFTNADKPLPPDLRAVKRKLGLTLIAFEDALIDLEPFIRVHPFETLNFLTNAVVHHYRNELLSQAVLILGSTDFLGNPIGFLHDLSEGVSGLVSDGNFGGLIKNVAHGAANSAAKFTGTLSYGISKATLYERYDERRLMLRRQARSERTREHLMVGLKGLGFGVLGGLTSIISETYDGFAHQGIPGIFTGLGWGLIGTVSKPAIGILDFATGAATAVRESSRSARKQLPPRLRLPRLTTGKGGSMPAYSFKDALGQQLLLRMFLSRRTGSGGSEVYVGHEQLLRGAENLQILISSSRVVVFGVEFAASNDGLPSGQDKEDEAEGQDRRTWTGLENCRMNVMLEVMHQDLDHASCVVVDTSSRALPADPAGKDVVNARKRSKEQLYYYIQLKMRWEGDGGEEQRKRPQIRCDEEKVALTVVNLVNYARNMYDETVQAVIEETESDDCC